jgi:GrpB-like predicted nucleotidyltransferase (UPF0157 family)
VSQVVVSAPDPEWPGEFEAEARRLSAALGARALVVHHIGSTAVPGIDARPVIDLALEVRDAADLDALEPIAALGYVALGEHGIPQRRFFVRGDGGRRTHNLFVFPTGHPAVQACLLLRDWWITHADEAAGYAALKRELAARYPDDLTAYLRGKDPLVAATLARAAQAARDQEES